LPPGGRWDIQQRSIQDNCSLPAEVPTIKQVSVIIPTLNEERLLPGLLADLALQRFRDFEVVVADACSRDRTRKIAREAGCVVVDGGLPGAGRNAGARASRGTLLLFLDADVRIGPGFVGDAAREFLRRRLAVATCAYDPDRSDHGIARIFRIYNWVVQRSPHVRPGCGGACILIPRSLFGRIGGFDIGLRVAEDGELVRRAARHGRFRTLRTVRLVLSTRRVRAEGALRFAIRVLLTELYLVLRPRIHGISIFSEGLWDRKPRAPGSAGR
jgi:glycosyltransferase involved in cell wall biosynthesis